MVDYYTPIMHTDNLETCTQCYAAVSQFYMFEHEKMHEEMTKLLNMITPPMVHIVKNFETPKKEA